MLLNANEAKEKTKEAIEKYLTEELQQIEKLINEAIKKGQYHIFIERKIKDLTLAQLKKLGYEVEIGGRYNESNTIIKWE